MAINISVKNVPDEVISRLRERAKRNHRSLQGELLAILEETVSPRRLSAREAYMKVMDLGLTTATDSASLLREDRDAR